MARVGDYKPINAGWVGSAGGTFGATLAGHRGVPQIIAVAIAGESGAGKSRLTRQLHRRLAPDSGILALDDFYRDLSHMEAGQRDLVNFDSPRALDWALFRSCLEAVLQGLEVRLPRYDFHTHTRRGSPRLWRPRRIVLVEGLWPWARRGLAGCYSLRVFLDVPAEVRFARRRRRDVKERGRTVQASERQWHHQTAPMGRKHVWPQRRTANFILGPNLPLRELDRLERTIRTVAGLPPR